MDASTQAIIYTLLVIPTFFALTVMIQGIVKLIKGEKDGAMATGFGVFLLVLITAAYFLFIR